MNQKLALTGGVVATFACSLMSCQENKQAPVASTPTTAVAESAPALKIAYVQVDSLLSKYQLSIDLNEAMIRKEENIRATLNQKGSELEREMREFQHKLQNNGFTSQERAEQEQARIIKKQQDLEALQGKLYAELQKENEKNNIALRDSLNAFLKTYNQEKKYSFILSNSGMDNLLIADPAYNITTEVVAGLNERYVPVKK